jgi:hypothetical protein
MRFVLTPNGLSTMLALRVSAKELGLFMIAGEWCAKTGNRLIPIDTVCRILSCTEEEADAVALGLVDMGLWGMMEEYKEYPLLVNEFVWRFADEDES